MELPAPPKANIHPFDEIFWRVDVWAHYLVWANILLMKYLYLVETRSVRAEAFIDAKLSSEYY